jgi:hypothetical protein
MSSTLPEFPTLAGIASPAKTRDDLAQQFESLGGKIRGLARQARDISAGSRQARDQACANWVPRQREDDRDDRGYLLCSHDCLGPIREILPVSEQYLRPLHPTRRLASRARNVPSSEFLITSKISAVVVSCFSASRSSRVSRTASVSWLPSEESLSRAASGGLVRLSNTVLRRRFLT